MPLALHEFHRNSGAVFGEINGQEVVLDYGDWMAEYAALREGAGIIDTSFRRRHALVGADRQRFLNGQVTNNVKDLRTGQGCYAALVSAKGKLQSDLNIYCLENEILLDFEPGYTGVVSQRLEKYVIAEDVQIVDAGEHYGMLSVQGPKASMVAGVDPDTAMAVKKIEDPALGELYAPPRINDLAARASTFSRRQLR